MLNIQNGTLAIILPNKNAMALGPNTADDNEREKERASNGCNIRHALSHRRTGNRCSA